jgi:hypothetical protein
LFPIFHVANHQTLSSEGVEGVEEAQEGSPTHFWDIMMGAVV